MAGRYESYDSKVKSDIPWVGDFPEHWVSHQLKRSVEGCINGIWGNEPDGENDLVVIRVADFDRQKLSVSDSKLTVRSISNSERSSRSLSYGDLLIEKSGGGENQLVGAVMRYTLPYDAVTSNFVARMPVRVGYVSDFLVYVFHHLYAGKVNFPSIKQTTGMQNLDSTQYLSERFCFPPLEEQKAIARFLDHETAKIDELIAKQERLIELLKEKRQAVISHAVTKGLNPDVPMKDSGVEWLGEVPEHWGVTRIKFYADVKGRIGFRGYTADDLVDEGEGALVVGATEMTLDGAINLDSPQYISWEKYYESPEIMLQQGDVLVVQRGSTVGKAAWIVNDMGSATINPSLVVFKRVKVVPEFLIRFLHSSSIKAQVKMLTAATAIPMLSQEQIGNFSFALPDEREQQAIVNYLAARLGRFTKLISKAETAIGLMKERRTALISAAVTGKIDVRNWKPDDNQ